MIGFRELIQAVGRQWGNGHLQSCGIRALNISGEPCWVFAGTSCNDIKGGQFAWQPGNKRYHAQHVPA
jgi:hypothetical protein